MFLCHFVDVGAVAAVVVVAAAAVVAMMLADADAVARNVWLAAGRCWLAGSNDARLARPSTIARLSARCWCVRACVRACVCTRACVCVCVFQAQEYAASEALARALEAAEGEAKVGRSAGRGLMFVCHSLIQVLLSWWWWWWWRQQQRC